ncbi:hypothetical protein FO519_000844 [Halicephalobus sp. NKZ332]|nr:hypothetical protein FO519_000844 [Halicephalobus sp. NKZ332]
MEDPENSEDDTLSSEFVSSMMMRDQGDSNPDRLTTQMDNGKNDSGVDLQSLLAGTDKLGYEPPDRSRNNQMMAAILDGIVPEGTADPSEGFVENLNLEAGNSKPIPLTRETGSPGRYTNLMDFYLHQVLPSLEGHKDFDLFSDLAPKRVPQGYTEPLFRPLGLNQIKTRILNLCYTKAEECFDDVTETLYYYPQDFYDFENPRSIHVIYNRCLFQRMTQCMHEHDVPEPSNEKLPNSPENLNEELKNLST